MIPITPSLIESKDYRHFINGRIAQLKSGEKGFSYEKLARRAGFASKSFAKDVGAGRKRLTPRSLPKMILGLGLHGAEKTLLQHLVGIEEDGNSEAVQKKLEKTRQKLRNLGLKKALKETAADVVYQSLATLQVFTALGDFNVGATKEEILDRTSLSVKEIEETLETLSSEGLVTIQNDRFCACDDHVTFRNLADHLNFKKIFRQALNLARSQAEMDFASREKLFLQSTFPVQKENLAQLKQRLRDTIEEFVQEASDSPGNKIQVLQLAMF